MDQQANIDTVGLGYEETAYNSQQPRTSHTSTGAYDAEVQDALSLASTLQQLRLNRLNGQNGS